MMVSSNGNNSSSSGAAQISVRCEPQHELVGLLPAAEGRHNRLALSSFQAEMPNNVKTTNKPIVLMTAPERKLNREGHGIEGQEAAKLGKTVNEISLNEE